MWQKAREHDAVASWLTKQADIVSALIEQEGGLEALRRKVARADSVFTILEEEGGLEGLREKVGRANSLSTLLDEEGGLETLKEKVARGNSVSTLLQEEGGLEGPREKVARRNSVSTLLTKNGGVNQVDKLTNAPVSAGSLEALVREVTRGKSMSALVEAIPSRVDAPQPGPTGEDEESDFSDGEPITLADFIKSGRY
jgi:hypothetical protein